MDEDLRRQIESICEDALAEVREWIYPFKTTRRRNGTIIPEGEPRDAVDTAETISKVVVEPAINGIDIFFANDDAMHVLNEVDSYHAEITGIMVESIVEEVPVLLIEDFFRRQGFDVLITED